MDVAKATFDFCLLSRTEACLWRGEFSNDARAIERFFHQLRARGWKLEQIHFALEATGVYGQRLIAALHQAGLAVSVLNPAQVKYFALSVLRRTKNDTVDAQIIARFCRERKPLATRALRPIETQLKLLVRERDSRVVEQTPEHNRAKKDPYQLELPKLRPNAVPVTPFMAKPASPKSATPSCVKLFTCRPLSLGVGVNPLSLGSQSLKTENSMTSLSAAPSKRKLLHIAFGVLKHQQPFNPMLASVPKTL